MTIHNGKRITQRGGADAGRGDDAHGVTPVSLMMHHLNKGPITVPMVTDNGQSVGGKHDMRVADSEVTLAKKLSSDDKESLGLW